MQINSCVTCMNFPCQDVDHQLFRVPAPKIDPPEFDPAAVRLVLIAETAARAAEDDFYAHRDGLFSRTTRLVFEMAGMPFDTTADLLRKGIYLTTAVKCAKIGNGVCTATVQQCSYLLEQELMQFDHLKAILLMGDVAIKALAAIAKRSHEPRPIPAGSTYRIRTGEYAWRGVRVFPSYLQAGLNIFLETGKQAVIAEDVRRGLQASGLQ